MSKPTSKADAERLMLMLNALRLPATKAMWQTFAERADTEGWPAARFLSVPPFRRSPSVPAQPGQGGPSPGPYSIIPVPRMRILCYICWRVRPRECPVRASVSAPNGLRHRARLACGGCGERPVPTAQGTASNADSAPSTAGTGGGSSSTQACDGM